MTRGELWEVGYAQTHAEKLVEHLMEDENTFLIDLRHNPTTNYQLWTQESLVEKYGKHYKWFGNTLGNKNHHTGREIELVDPLVGVPILARALSKGKNLILLCGCKRYEDCHRRLVHELVTAELEKATVVYMAIVGSRGYPDLEAVCAYVRHLARKYGTTGRVVILSGGAPGVDEAAEQEADRLGMPKQIFRADWKKYGKSAGLRRNPDIIRPATHVMVFWDGISRGTQDSIRLAREMGKPLKIVTPSA